MNQKLLFALWGGLFILCAALGFIPEPEGAVRTLLTVLAALFFAPPALLLYNAGKRRDRDTIKLIRNLAALSLSLTLALLVASFVTAMGSAVLGTLLHYVLVVVSSPMVCSGVWAMSLFFWACVLMASLSQLRKL